MTSIVESLADLAGRYEAAFVDLWGCVHDGVQAHPAACDALAAFREGGGRVVLVTNAPRPRASVEAQIARLGVPRDAWDAIATSGDAARVAMFRGAIGAKVFFMGQDVDLPFFDPPEIVENPLAIERVPLDEAEGIACCGPFDGHAEPEVNREAFSGAIARGLPLLCANPDIVVDRGASREYCAGALARLYEAMGGRALYYGKPHLPIYQLARERLAELGPLPPDARILAVGDGARTDVLGAQAAGLDCLFVSGGLAAAETGTAPGTAPGGQPDPARLDAYLSHQGLSPRWTVGFLR